MQNCKSTASASNAASLAHQGFQLLETLNVLSDYEFTVQPSLSCNYEHQSRLIETIHKMQRVLKDAEDCLDAAGGASQIPELIVKVSLLPVNFRSKSLSRMH